MTIPREVTVCAASEIWPSRGIAGDFRNLMRVRAHARARECGWLEDSPQPPASPAPSPPTVDQRALVPEPVGPQ